MKRKRVDDVQLLIHSEVEDHHQEEDRSQWSKEFEENLPSYTILLNLKSFLIINGKNVEGWNKNVRYWSDETIIFKREDGSSFVLMT